MAPRAPHIKNLTPIGRGPVVKHTGKGSLQQSRAGAGGRESLTGGGFGAALNRYPKPVPMPPPPAGSFGSPGGAAGVGLSSGDDESLG